MDEAKVDMADFVKHLVLTVTVKHVRIPAARLWLGLIVVRFGAWIIGLGGVNVRNAEAEVRDTRTIEEPPE